MSISTIITQGFVENSTGVQYIITRGFHSVEIIIDKAFPEFGWRGQLSGFRFNASSFSNGRTSDGSKSVISFTASVQPVSGREMLTLPEGYRNKEVYRLFTSFQLYPARENENKKADRVTIAGRTFEVIRADNWTNNVMNHYSPIVSEING